MSPEAHNVLSDGHLFLGDDTPGIAEVDFTAGLSSMGVWKAQLGTCGQLYCHGNGKGDNGSKDHSGQVRGCTSCHAGRANPLGWLGMSGEHGKHLLEGIQCQECHATTAASSSTILDPALHVDGTVQVAFEEDLVFNGSTCTGNCHGEQHNGRGW